MAICVQRQTMNCTNALKRPTTATTRSRSEMCVAALHGEQLHCLLRQHAADRLHADRPARRRRHLHLQRPVHERLSATGPRTACAGPAAAAPAIGERLLVTRPAPRATAASARPTPARPIVALNGTCDTAHPCDRGFSCVGENTKTMTAAPARRRPPASAPPAAARCRAATDARPLLRRPERRQDLHAGHLPRLQRQRQRRRRRGDRHDGGGGDGAAGAPPTPAGTPCGQLADGSRVGCVAGDCYTATGLATGSDQGTCKPFANDGDPCDTVVGPGLHVPRRAAWSRAAATAARRGPASSPSPPLLPVAASCGPAAARPHRDRRGHLQ